jgi:holo-[acyl-carrier protein] synthase
MEIVGLGNEIVECVRIRGMIDRYGESFLHRTFTSGEIRFCQSRRQVTELFSCMWAAKEAVMKCLNATGRLHRVDVEIVPEGYGSARVFLHGTARERAAELNVVEIKLTVAHCRTYATATAIALRRAADF